MCYCHRIGVIVVRSCLCAILLLLTTLPAVADTLAIKLFASEFPPLQYPGPDGDAQGYVHQFLQEALQRTQQQLGTDVTFKADPLSFLPLKRALLNVQTTPNSLLLSVARTPDREQDMLWVAVVSPYDIWLYRKRSTLPKPTDILALRGRGYRIGVQDGSNVQEWLLKQGIGQPPDNTLLDPVPQNALNLGKAVMGRIDFFAHPDISLGLRAREQRVDPRQLEPVFRLDALSTPLWLAANKQTDPRLISALRQQLQLMAQQGRLDALQKAWHDAQP